MRNLLRVRVTDTNEATSIDAPAVTVFHDRAYVLYRDEASGLSCFEFDGAWGAPIHLDGLEFEVRSSPAAAVLRSRFCVAYRSTNDDIHLTMFDGTDWTPPINAGALVNAKTSHAPAMVEYADELVIVYKHSDTHDMYAFTFDGCQPSPQIRITDLNGAATSGAPAAVPFEDTVHIVYRGLEASDLWTCTFDGFRASDPESLTGLTGIRSSSTPSLLVRDRDLYACYRGVGEAPLRAIRRTNAWEFRTLDLSDALALDRADGLALTRLGEPLLFALVDGGVVDAPDVGEAILAVAKEEHSPGLIASLVGTSRRHPLPPRLTLVGGDE